MRDDRFYLVAYDIAHPRRLRRVARSMERAALRVQKSVFLFHGSEEQLQSLLQRVRPLLEPSEDLVQAWRLQGHEAQAYLGSPRSVQPAAVVLDSSTSSLITNVSNRRTRKGITS